MSENYEQVMINRKKEKITVQGINRNRTKKKNFMQ